MTNTERPGGWIGRPIAASPPPARMYSNPAYPSWEIYQHTPDGGAATYFEGTKVAAYDSFAAAAEAVTEAVAGMRAVRDLPLQVAAPVGPNPNRDPVLYTGPLTAAPLDLLYGDGKVESLVAMETAARLTRLAIQTLARVESGPAAEAPRHIKRVYGLLSAAAGELTSRVVTTEKDRELSDRIVAAAQERVQKVMDRLDRPMTFARIPDGVRPVGPEHKHQRAFLTPGDGYGVITRVTTGEFELEFTPKGGRTTVAYRGTADDAMTKLAELALNVPLIPEGDQP